LLAQQIIVLNNYFGSPLKEANETNKEGDVGKSSRFIYWINNRSFFTTASLNIEFQLIPYQLKYSRKPRV